MKKKFLSILLTLAMVVTMIPMFGVTANAEPTGQALPKAGGYLEPGSYYLDEDMEIANTLVIAYNRTVNIDLNGHVLTKEGNGNVITVSYANLTITDSNANIPHNFKVNERGLWEYTTETEGAIPYENLDNKPAENTIITVKGGCITGGKANYGGGICNMGGRLYFNGGNVIGNEATESGGGIRASGITIIDGGSIIGCVAPNGGGLINTKNCALEISSGCISCCSATKGGGGVYSTGKFDMKGGTIENCEANTGGGVYSAGTFNMTDGTIANCEANTGGAVYAYSAGCTFTMSGGNIKNCTAVEKNNIVGQGGNVYIKEAKFNMSGNAIIEGDGITQNAKNGGGVFVNGGQFVMEGGTIKNCVAENNGGGIDNYAKVDGEEYGFTMTGGEIIGCKASYGGGVFCNGYQTYYPDTKLSGGLISGNIASKGGGGVYIGPLTETLLAGSIVIKNNKDTNNKASNLTTLNKTDGEIIGGIKVGTFEEGASIGITYFNEEKESDIGTIIVDCNNDALKYFNPDSVKYGIEFVNDTTNGHLELVKKECGIIGIILSAASIIIGGKIYKSIISVPIIFNMLKRFSCCKHWW